MRFKIILTKSSGNNFLPVAYQYYISAWIYNSITKANSEFAQFLHEKGYGKDNKKFKFFNFGPLQLSPYYLHKERGVFELLGNEVTLEVSFFLSEIAEPFIKGIFLDNNVFIGDRINGVQLEVSEIQLLFNPIYSETMTYRVVSPCCVTRPPGDSEQYAQYLNPQDKDYKLRLIENLNVKYAAARNVPTIAGGLTEDLPAIDIEILTKSPRSKLITIKPFTQKETKIRGWLYDCEVTAPIEVQEFIYTVGLGEKGSLGFGMVKGKSY